MNTTIKRDNYTEQVFANSCWVATGQNMVNAIESNKSKPNITKRTYDQYSLYFDACKEYGRGLPEGAVKVSESEMYQNEFNKQINSMNAAGGTLGMCATAAKLYSRNNHDFGFMDQTVRYAFFVSDITRFGWTYGIYLKCLRGASGGVGDHMVLACGVDNRTSERVTCFDPAGSGNYVTVAYSSLVNGTSSAFGNPSDLWQYTGTVFCND